MVRREKGSIGIGIRYVCELIHILLCRSFGFVFLLET